MRRVFIDLGSFDGDTARTFLAKYPNAGQYEIHAFEPDLRCDSEYPAGVVLHREAAWVADGPAYLHIGDAQASTLMVGKTTGNLSAKALVECIDFTRWLRGNCGGAEVVLKMDIEGAEYAVLERMLDEGAISLVRELHVDWHWHKVGVHKDQHDAIVNRLRATGIRLHDNSEGQPHFLEVT